jgi:hypothetical protein
MAAGATEHWLAWLARRKEEVAAGGAATENTEDRS